MREHVLAAIESDPSLARLREAARGALERAGHVDPGHDLAHCVRVAAWTLRLGGADVDPREAIAAALLHDVVNVPKNSPDRARASEWSADAARPLLVDAGLPDAAIVRVTDAIRDHAWSRGAVPATALGRALQDADRLEALGVLGVFRCISTGVAMGGTYFDPGDPWAERRPLDDVRWSLDHFARKLFGLAATMRTEAGRAEAERRTATLRTLCERLGEELGVPWPGAAANPG
jgi:uncharacterized protein